MSSVLRNFLMLMMLCSLFMTKALAQQIIVSTGFNSYSGTSATMPSGWYLSWNSSGGTSGTSYYTSPGNYGSTPPSYKLGIDNDSIMSPPFSGADTVSFFVRGSGFTFSDANTLSIYESSDSINWTLIEAIDSLPTFDTTFYEPIQALSTHLMFVYHKVSGNLAIDDIKITHFVVGIPVANFYSQGACNGDSVYFTDQTIIYGGNISTWSWDFGDGTLLTYDQSPVHLYSDTGTYQVKLLVTDNTSDMDSITIPVTVFDIPVIHLTAASPLSGCVSFCKQFFDSSTVHYGTINGFSRQWDFGDGGTSGQKNPTHCYTTAGTYSVSLTNASSFGCSASESVASMINVYDKPIAEFSFTDSAGVFKFTNESTGASTFNWDFGDNSGSSTLDNPEYTYTSDTIFSVCLIAQTSQGCVDTICHDLQVTGMKDLSSENHRSFSICPNPASSTIQITLKSITYTPGTITIYDLIGNKLLAQNTSGLISNINLNYIPEGLYIIRFSNEAECQTKRLIIAR